MDEKTRKKISEARTGYRVPGYHPYRDNPRIARIYDSMKSRCCNSNRQKYESYGARGIYVCDEWKDNFNEFCSWALSNGYSDNLQLDRIENNGPYSPENCRWVTAKENSRNRRNSKYLTLYGIRKTVAEWCETIDISEYTIYWWLREYGEEECAHRVYQRLSRIA